MDSKVLSGPFVLEIEVKSEYSNPRRMRMGS
jgi:hypothetical protein